MTYARVVTVRRQRGIAVRIIFCRVRSRRAMRILRRGGIQDRVYQSFHENVCGRKWRRPSYRNHADSSDQRRLVTLCSEFKCYGKYIFPVLFVFGVLAIGISLSIFGWKKGWFDKR